CRLGVEDASVRFDPTRGGKFAGYARGFVMNRIRRLHQSYDRDRKARPPRGNRAALWDDGGLVLEDPEINAGLLAAIDEGLLSEGDYWLLNRRTVQRQTQAEVAASVGCSVRTLRRDEKAALTAIESIIAWL